MKNLWIWIIVAGLLGPAAVAPAASAQSTGGDMGWYVIHCNIYDANVYLDDSFVGTISQGTLTVPALTTGTVQDAHGPKKWVYDLHAGPDLRSGKRNVDRNLCNPEPYSRHNSYDVRRGHGMVYRAVQYRWCEVFPLMVLTREQYLTDSCMSRCTRRERPSRDIR